MAVIKFHPYSSPMLQAWITTSQTGKQVRESLLAWWPKAGRSLVRDRFSSKTASAVVEPEDVESFDSIFEDDEVDVEDLNDEEVVLSRAWEDNGRG